MQAGQIMATNEHFSYAQTLCEAMQKLRIRSVASRVRRQSLSLAGA